MKNAKKKSKCGCKKGSTGTSKCWVSHMLDFHYGNESVYDKFPIPIGTTKLSGFKFILPVTPSGTSGMSGWLMLIYESDVQNSGYPSTLNQHGLYEHKILYKDLGLGSVTAPHLIDETFTFNLDFDFNTTQTINVVYLVEGKAPGIDVHPTVSFEFDCPKSCCPKKVYNINIK